MEPEDEAALQALNALREQAVAPLRTLRLALAKARTVDEQVRAIAALLETLDAAGRLQAQQDALEQAGQAQRAQECGQLYDCLLYTSCEHNAAQDPCREGKQTGGTGL